MIWADFRKSCFVIELIPPQRTSATYYLVLIHSHSRLGGGELGDSLGPLGHGVLGKLTGKHEADSGLNLTRRESRLLVVGRELPGLTCDALEDVIDERVHDAHPLLADAGVGVDLLEDLVDVGRVRLDPLLAALFLAVGRDLLGSLGRRLLGGCFGHGWIRLVLMNVKRVEFSICVTKVGKDEACVPAPSLGGIYLVVCLWRG